MEIPAAVVRFLGLFCRFPHRDGKNDENGGCEKGR
jgi:hypothetical protein